MNLPRSSHVKFVLPSACAACLSMLGAGALANRPPVPVLNGIEGRQHVAIDARSGSQVTLTPQGSTDPDGDRLTFDWLYYPEPGTYRGAASVAAPSAVEASVAVPADAAGTSIHIVLVVTDNGEPALARYRRAVIPCRERTPAAPGRNPPA